MCVVMYHDGNEVVLILTRTPMIREHKLKLVSMN